MAEEKMMRLSLAARKLNVSVDSIRDTLGSNGHNIDKNPNAKLTTEQLEILEKEFGTNALLSEESDKPSTPSITPEEKVKSNDGDILYFREEAKGEVRDEPQVAPSSKVLEEPQTEVERVKFETKLEGPKVLGKLDLNPKKDPEPKPLEEPKEEEIEPSIPEKVTQVEEPKVAEIIEEAAPVKEEEEVVEEVATIAEEKREEEVMESPKVLEEPPAPAVKAPDQPKEQVEEQVELIKAKGEKLAGLTVVGKIELPSAKAPSTSSQNSGSNAADKKKKRKRKRVSRLEGLTDITDQKYYNKKEQEGGDKGAITTNKDNKGRNTNKKDLSASDVKDSMKQTMARMQSKGPDFGAKNRREKRRQRAEKAEFEEQLEQEASGTLKVTEFISASELASMMDVSVNEIIGTCMKMGMFVSINQRLDAETIQLIALEYDYDVEFISAEEEVTVDALEIEDAEEDLKSRAPIVTIMGHVDHGKTSLLDYIRTTKVASGEAGGITQHIGAYSVEMTSGENKGKSITFLDTPGHEAFTAMRARGAKITDVAIVVISADDSVMPQTREAINHAQNANVPIVFALNKIDKPGANPDKIREDLSKENILVESWGGKYQEQEVSAKTGLGIEDLLDKVLLESEILELKANPDRKAVGTVIEASLDKGRGYVATVLVQKGTLKVGDIILAGQYFGRVRAMIDDLGERIKEAGPSMPVQILGLPGAPQAGDIFNVMDSDRDAREIANKREQIMREQTIRARRHITLDEIGRRKAIGSFKELNIIVKGDVDGSVEALADSLLKLSNEEVQVNIVHKGVGQISESDVLLSSAADAIIVGFQVRPSNNAKKLAENEEIEIRLYSIIYDAINEIKDAMEGLLAPTEEEVVTGNIEVREVFKISKVGTVAGCYVLDGFVKRNNKVRIIRDGIVLFEGAIDQLKRFKDDVSEVKAGYECGLKIAKFNDLNIGDIIESYEIQEIKRKLK